MSIGQRIKAIRKQQGLTIDELAGRLGKNRTTIYRYENGDIENLPLGILDPLADALDTTPTYLMGWDNSNGLCHGYSDRNEYSNANVEQVTQWFDEIGANVFSDDERQKIVEYARFLLTIRDK